MMVTRALKLGFGFTNLCRFLSPFQRCNWIKKNNYFCTVFLRSFFILWRLISHLVIMITQYVFLIFSSSNRPPGRHPSYQTIWTAPDETTKSKYNIVSPTTKSDHQSRPPSPIQNSRSDQIRSPHQTTVHHPPNRTVYSASFKWYRSGAFFMGWVKGGI